jgi:hypothetical protein
MKDGAIVSIGKLADFTTVMSVLRREAETDGLLAKHRELSTACRTVGDAGGN